MKQIFILTFLVSILITGALASSAYAQKPAGFGDGYAGGFDYPGSGVTTNRSRMENDDALRAGNVMQVQPPVVAQQPQQRAPRCGCAPGDRDNYGIGCRHWDYNTGAVNDYPYGDYGPWTPQCGTGPNP